MTHRLKTVKFRAIQSAVVDPKETGETEEKRLRKTFNKSETNGMEEYRRGGD
ncbi:MAG: hypothetical protein ISQ09_06705 [Rubripirellula sp.]|nr:hypothetical protein [Rubripirellula sp.]